MRFAVRRDPALSRRSPGALPVALPRFCPRQELPLPPDLPGRTGWGLKGDNRVWDALIILEGVIYLIPLCLAFCCDPEGSGAFWLFRAGVRVELTG